MKERRFWTRVPRFLEAQWIAPAGLKATARVSDLSFGGCYLSTLVTPRPGSHCQVFLFLPNEGVTVAIKVLPQAFAQDADRLARFVIVTPASPVSRSKMVFGSFLRCAR